MQKAGLAVKIWELVAGPHLFNRPTDRLWSQVSPRDSVSSLGIDLGFCSEMCSVGGTPSPKWGDGFLWSGPSTLIWVVVEQGRFSILHWAVRVQS